jgi:hypothetical protein
MIKLKKIKFNKIINKINNKIKYPYLNFKINNSKQIIIQTNLIKYKSKMKKIKFSMITNINNNKINIKKVNFKNRFKMIYLNNQIKKFNNQIK